MAINRELLLEVCSISMAQRMNTKLFFVLLFFVVLSQADNDEPEPRAYGQWIAINIDFKSFGTESLEVKNADLSWGKWYDYPEKKTELSSINGWVVRASTPMDKPIAACGRENASSGTEGSFDLYLGSLKVAKISFDVPWGLGSNKLTSDSACSDCVVQIPNISKEGAIGLVTIKIAYMGSLKQVVQA